MKLLKKCAMPGLKDNFKAGDKIYVTTWDFDGRTSFQKTILYIIQKVNRVTLHVLDQNGDVFVMNPNENGTQITFAKHQDALENQREDQRIINEKLEACPRNKSVWDMLTTIEREVYNQRFGAPDRTYSTDWVMKNR